MKTRIVADPGSTHEGKKENCIELINIATKIGVDVLKFQLFKGKEYEEAGNIPIPYEWWEDLYEHAMKVNQEIAASVFDDEALSVAIRHPIPFVKIAYSKKHKLKWINEAMERANELIVSCDVMTEHLIPDECTKLYCIPEYPVRYVISFEGLFPRFDGFSDHTLGYDQSIRAAEAGAYTIEKHLKLKDEHSSCPDAYFALNPNEFEQMIRRIKG